MPQKIVLSLTRPQEEFTFSEAKYPALVGGLGCMRDSTEIITSSGVKCFADLKEGNDVLSWSERDQIFQLSPASGAFPKGKENLYRVITTRGEFVASEQHLVYVRENMYLPVCLLSRQLELNVASQRLIETSSGVDRIWSRANDLSYWQTLLNYQGDYESLSHLYGQQLLKARDNALFSALQQGDAQIFLGFFFLSVISRLDDQLVLLQKHNRLDQFFFLRQMKYFYDQWVIQAGVLVSQIHSLFFERIFDCIQVFEKSRRSLYCHRKEILYSQSRAMLLEFFSSCLKDLLAALEDSFHEQALLCSTYSSLSEKPFRDKSESHHKFGLNSGEYCSFNNSTTKATIIHVERLKRKEWYWDMHVAGNNNYVSADGAIHHNSGKSEAGISRLLYKVMSMRGLYGGYYMPNYDLLELRAMSGFMEALERSNLSYQLNKSKYYIDLLHCGGRIIFRSYDKPERIVAYEVAHSIVDEIDTLPKDKAAIVWRKISERNRQKCGEPNTIGAVTTPDQGYSGFVYQKWGKNPSKDHEVIKARTDSNPFLADGYIEQIMSNYDPILADMYISGEFVSLSRNKVYHFFDRKKHSTNRSLKDTDNIIHIGLDFNIGGCCANVWIIENNTPIAVDEFISHDTRDFCIKASRYIKPGRKIIVYPDASGRSARTNASQSDVDIIVQSGFSVDAPQNNPPVRDRINSFNGLLAHDRIKINSDKCQLLVDALESQGYDKKGEPEKFDVHPSIDDHLDSAGYFIHRKFPIIRPMSQIRIGGGLSR